MNGFINEIKKYLEDTDIEFKERDGKLELENSTVNTITIEGECIKTDEEKFKTLDDLDSKL